MKIFNTMSKAPLMLEFDKKLKLTNPSNCPSAATERLCRRIIAYLDPIFKQFGYPIFQFYGNIDSFEYDNSLFEMTLNWLYPDDSIDKVQFGFLIDLNEFRFILMDHQNGSIIYEQQFFSGDLQAVVHECVARTIHYCKNLP